MCGRYVLAASAEDYAEHFRVDRILVDSLAPSYNVAPTDPVYAIAEWDHERLLGIMRWGLIPHWAKDAKAIQINARSETIARKPMFRQALSRRRCIIPADGFYEWEPKENGRAPHWVFRNDGFPFAFAGIYSTWVDPVTEQRSRTCAIVTTKAVGVISTIHHRMPVSLDEEVWDTWLDRDLVDPDQVVALLRPIDADLVAEYRVASDVNHVRNNSPDLTSPLPTR